MKTCILLLAALVLASPLAAQDFSRLPHKAPGVNSPSAPAPAGERVGGDTIETALAFSTVPYTDSGSTDGFVDDYDSACPTESTASDVVYAFTPPASDTYYFDLCGSAYDTKLYLMDADLNVIACNDDHYQLFSPCGDFTSKLTDVFLPAGVTVYVVIDGFDEDAYGEYQLSVGVSVPCTKTCPPAALPEGEPALQYGVDDAYNCGCQCAGAALFQPVDGDHDGEAVYCIHSGWRSYGTPDTDWLSFLVGASGSIHVDIDTDYGLMAYAILGDTDCFFYEIVGNVVADACGTAAFDFQMDPGSTGLLYLVPYSVGPTTGVETVEFAATVGFAGLAVPQAADPVSWGAVKSMYR